MQQPEDQASGSTRNPTETVQLETNAGARRKTDTAAVRLTMCLPLRETVSRILSRHARYVCTRSWWDSGVVGIQLTQYHSVPFTDRAPRRRREDSLQSFQDCHRTGREKHGNSGSNRHTRKRTTMVNPSPIIGTVSTPVEQLCCITKAPKTFTGGNSVTWIVVRLRLGYL